ncbi:hypothetical protein Cs7R123_59980 [Catellatospora sp. TT07R-123]|uniref:hypothetical protein n=1 Tax=Catellatospora sp. TT07R-123 TaxID=2733863 RepID=UPI001B2D4854|nr:hypothetical protein [Catellatospora sp. TT07R-123]GHJ48656.1 hypothetical protein Cs7R123_59980 [Catellatospora sp. TT07R-123]
MIDADGEAPTNALLSRELSRAAQVVIVEAAPNQLDRADAARIVLRGGEIADLAGVLAIVDGGTGDHCRCLGWPTILLLDGEGTQLACWTLHHQTGLRGPGNCDADLRDGPVLSEWLARRGLAGSLRVQQHLAAVRAREEARRRSWVDAAPADLTSAAESASLGKRGAETRLAGAVMRRYPEVRERIRVLLGWAGFTVRYAGGTPWHELIPQRILLQEPSEAVFTALAAAPLSVAQLDGAAELFTSFEWTQADPPALPEALRATLISHVTAVGTEPMKFRMHYGYGAPAA